MKEIPLSPKELKKNRELPSEFIQFYNNNLSRKYEGKKMMVEMPAHHIEWTDIIIKAFQSVGWVVEPWHSPNNEQYLTFQEPFDEGY